MCTQYYVAIQTLTTAELNMQESKKVQTQRRQQKMTQRTLNRCSNELPNDFRAKLHNPSNFESFAFGGSLSTNCSTPGNQTSMPETHCEKLKITTSNT